jgi:hypothetical protein
MVDAIDDVERVHEEEKLCWEATIQNWKEAFEVERDKAAAVQTQLNDKMSELETERNEQCLSQTTMQRIGDELLRANNEIARLNTLLKDEESKKPYTVGHALTKIDTSSILFFLGILLAIGGLESFGYLHALSDQLAASLGNQSLIITIIGLASAVVDNVPLVAATMGMYSLADFPMDHEMWEYLAFCAGTGGSILIIGSAAGVAVMGMEKIEFGWYLKKIGFLALLGYFAGAGLYLLLH